MKMFETWNDWGLNWVCTHGSSPSAACHHRMALICNLPWGFPERFWSKLWNWNFLGYWEEGRERVLLRGLGDHILRTASYFHQAARNMFPVQRGQFICFLQWKIDSERRKCQVMAFFLSNYNHSRESLSYTPRLRYISCVSIVWFILCQLIKNYL